MSLSIVKDATEIKVNVGVDDLASLAVIAQEVEDDAASAAASAATASAIVGSGNGLFPNGTVSLPSISFADDTDTGIYKPVANTVAITTAGVERLRVTPTGSVGIGSATPAEKLDVNGNVKITGLLSGTAVTQSDTDTTAGRLLTTGAGPVQAFRHGNILGTVSQTSGVPTGAIIERGSNANGEYVRFADGTQICTRTTLDLLYFSATICRGDWTFPAAFASSPSVSAIPNFGASLLTGGPSFRDVHIYWSNSGANNTTFRVEATQITSAASFVSGNYVRVVTLLAIGRWF